MSKAYLGIDTSNYTSSCAVYLPETDGVISKRQLLPVSQGEQGLRQSDAVFHHSRNLPPLLSSLFEECEAEIACVSASFAPRDDEKSYMPCFTVGVGYSLALSSALHVKRKLFSHQSGHIAAAVLSSGHRELINKEFLAFHVSGGTTELLHVKPDREKIFDISLVSSSLDLKAGQAVDRTGVMLGLPFPSGKYIDALACQSDKEFIINPYMRDGNVSFSGLQNKCEDMFKNNGNKCDIAKYCIEYIYYAVKKMTEEALRKYNNLPVLYVGGVMSDSIIRERLANDGFGYFALPEYSSDNAAGTAYLGYLSDNFD